MHTVEGIGREHHGGDAFGTGFSYHLSDAIAVIGDERIGDAIVSGDSEVSHSGKGIFDAWVRGIRGTIDRDESFLGVDAEDLIHSEFTDFRTIADQCEQVAFFCTFECLVVFSAIGCENKRERERSLLVRLTLIDKSGLFRAHQTYNRTQHPFLDECQRRECFCVNVEYFIFS